MATAAAAAPANVDIWSIFMVIPRPGLFRN